MDVDKPQKAHRKAHSGRKAEKKKPKNAEQNNPKAFAMQSGRKAERMARRKAELSQQKLHVPLVDRTPVEPPPVVVAVAGPPGTGKSTLIRSLVKRYTRQNIHEINGPVTVVAGRKRRLTFIECSNDLNSMIDVAKVADLVLLMIDASYGFEMETFEFLNVLQSHGFPKIMGVLTHLDKFRNNKKLKKRKKMLKQRFWTEIYQGAKLFYLSGIINDRYPKTEILNLSRFVSVMKFRPLVWRNAHPYVLSDRIEDLTAPQLLEQNPKCDRKVAVMGYLRGTYMKTGARVHVPGAGDFTVADVSTLGDPCPLPESQRKSLSDKHRLIYAPMSDVGGVMYDKDAIYIHVPGNFTNRDAENENLGEGQKMVLDLQKFEGTLDSQLMTSSIRLFGESKPLSGDAVKALGAAQEDESDDDDDQEFGSEAELDEQDDDSGIDSASDCSEDEDDDDEAESRRPRRRASRGNADADQDEDIAFADDNLIELSDDEEYLGPHRARKELSLLPGLANRRKRVNLMDLVYSSAGGEDNAQGAAQPLDDDDDLLFVKRATTDGPEEDVLRPSLVKADLSKWDDEEHLESIRNLFITGELPEGEEGGQDGKGNDYEEEGGDFEDLEAGSTQGDDKEAEEEEDAREPTEEELMEQKRAQLKKKFDAEYDGLSDEEGEKEKTYFDVLKEQLQTQVQQTREEFEDDDEARIRVLGHCPGAYVRVVLENVPCELVDNFDPQYPVVLGGLAAGEDQHSFMQVRIKKHRWYKRILKTNDPLIISLGWRRFQTMPLFSLDDRIRNRMLKYTPLHMHCLATFYGPISAPNTGFCAFQSLETGTPDFRVAATGTVLDINKSTEIVKKLKLTGSAMKIYKNTAFVKDMFTSALEVAKFEGAAIKTVSGIRGQVKKAVQPEGCFRATFEDKILMSDIIFLKAWYPVKPKKFCNPITSLLLRDKSAWRGMRLANTVRHELGIRIGHNKDSSYREIQRPEQRVFQPLRIPKSLEQDLPFKSKPKVLNKQKKPGLLQRRAVVAEPHERRTEALLAQIRTLKYHREEKRKAKDQERREVYLKGKAKEEESRVASAKEKAKDFYRKLGKAEKRANEAQEGGGRRGKRAKRDD